MYHIKFYYCEAIKHLKKSICVQRNLVFQFFGMAVEWMIIFMQNMDVFKELVGLETPPEPYSDYWASHSDQRTGSLYVEAVLK